MLLYYITDRKSFAGTDAQQRVALLRRIADAARAGVDYIQLREKDLSPHDVERLACEAVRAVRDHSTTTKLLVNSRTDVAFVASADGVHLPASEVRALWMRCRASQPVIGVSAHSIADVRHAQAHGANFAVLAPVFEKVQTGTPGIGLEALRAACVEVRGFTMMALGGVTLSNARACIETGA